MSSYLEEYGAGEEQRARRLRRIKRGSIAAVLLLIVAVVVYAVFKNYPEQRQVKALIETLRKQDYQAAYRMFGCTEPSPCRDYAFAKFMEDSGPKSRHADASSPQVGVSQSSRTGVVFRVEYIGVGPVPLMLHRRKTVV